MKWRRKTPTPAPPPVFYPGCAVFTPAPPGGEHLGLYFDPRFGWLHSDPDFLAIMDRIGLKLPAR